MLKTDLTKLMEKLHDKKLYQRLKSTITNIPLLKCIVVCTNFTNNNAI